MTQEAVDKFQEWFIDQYLKYGDWFTEWWRMEGQESFFKWSKKHGQEFIDKALLNGE